MIFGIESYWNISSSSNNITTIRKSRRRFNHSCRSLFSFLSSSDNRYLLQPQHLLFLLLLFLTTNLSSALPNKDELETHHPFNPKSFLDGKSDSSSSSSSSSSYFDHQPTDHHSEKSLLHSLYRNDQEAKSYTDSLHHNNNQSAPMTPSASSESSSSPSSISSQSSESASYDWFDAFRDNRGPVLYSNVNRTPAVEDVQNVLIYTSFITLFLAFLIIFPGIRKEKLSTFICVTVSLCIGAVILVTNFGTSWHSATASISSPYRAFSKDKIQAELGVRVGLLSVNITLKALSSSSSSTQSIFHNSKYLNQQLNHHHHHLHDNPHNHHHHHYSLSDINFNERFYWIGPSEMKVEYQKALARGLPYPILTVAEYLSQDVEGFCWGRKYRQAGYYSSLLLWTAFCTWLLMNVLLCAVPRYGVYVMQLTGILMLLANTIYTLLLPKKPLSIPFENDSLIFSYGWSFWLCMAGGILSVVVGATLTVVDILFPYKFTTILEMDYDTPYRYFVGNDAHLFGQQIVAPKHHHPSQSSSPSSEHHSLEASLPSTSNASVVGKQSLSISKSNASSTTTTSSSGGGVEEKMSSRI